MTKGTKMEMIARVIFNFFRNYSCDLVLRTRIKHSPRMKPITTLTAIEMCIRVTVSYSTIASGSIRSKDNVVYLKQNELELKSNHDQHA